MHISWLVKAWMIFGLVLLVFCLPVAGQIIPNHPPLEQFPAAWRYTLFVRPSLLSEFNRVDGLVQALAVHARVPTSFNRPPVLAVFSRIDVRTVELPHYHVRGGTVGISSNLPRARLGDRDGIWAALDAKYYKQTTSPDNWIVGRTENTLAALMTKHDYKNYHQVEGYAISAEARYIPLSQIWGLSVAARWRDQHHRPLGTTTQWSLLPQSRSFRPNYTATNGRERILDFTIAAENKDTPRLARRLTKFAVAYETAGGAIGGDFQYEGLFCDLRLESATFGNQRLIMRLATGARSGSLAVQHRLRLGGIGTLRGLPHQEFTGNRFWMLNVEYLFGDDLLGRLEFFPFTTAPFQKVLPVIGLGWFYDLGTAYHVRETDQLLSGWFAGQGRDNWGVFLNIANEFIRIEWASSRLLGHEHNDILRIRTGWRL